MARLHAASFDHAWSHADITQLRAADGALTLVAGEGEVEGFVMARVVADEAEILTLTVEPGLRRAGLGHALLAAALDEAAARGAAAMFLEVAKDNGAALALYAAHEFSVVGSRPAYYTDGQGRQVDAAILRRALNKPPTNGYG